MMASREVIQCYFKATCRDVGCVVLGSNLELGGTRCWGDMKRAPATFRRLPHDHVTVGFGSVGCGSVMDVSGWTDIQVQYGVANQQVTSTEISNRFCRNDSASTG